MYSRRDDDDAVVHEHNLWIFCKNLSKGQWRVRENLGVEVDTTEGEIEISSVHVHDDDHHRDEECRRDHMYSPKWSKL